MKLAQSRIKYFFIVIYVIKKVAGETPAYLIYCLLTIIYYLYLYSFTFTPSSTSLPQMARASISFSPL